MGSAGVVFDLFHTLVNTEHLRPVGFDAVAEVANVIGVDPSTFAAFWDETYVERETTMLDLVGLTARFCDSAEVSVSGDQLEQVDVLLGVCKDDTLRSPDPAMVEMIASLAARCAVGVLSNCDAREVRHWMSSPLAEHVAVFGRSCEIGVMKPDVRSYRWVLDRLGVDPNDAIFVGNGSSGELDGARAAGFATVVHCNIYDATNGLVPVDEQESRAARADVSVATIDELASALLKALR
jgi:putative hydrolase of the HAD superfamily